MDLLDQFLEMLIVEYVAHVTRVLIDMVWKRWVWSLIFVPDWIHGNSVEIKGRSYLFQNSTREAERCKVSPMNNMRDDFRDELDRKRH